MGEHNQQTKTTEQDNEEGINKNSSMILTKKKNSDNEVLRSS